MEVFWRQGYEATSMTDLTSAMGINPPSLYAAFGDKERLFLEAVEHYSERYRKPFACALEEGKTAKASIAKMLLAAAIELGKSGRDRGCMLVMSATNCSATSIREAVAERRAQTRSRLKERIDRGVAEGDVPRGTDTEALADFYISVMGGMSLRARDGASRKSLLATAEAAMRAWPERSPR